MERKIVMKLELSKDVLTLSLKDCMKANQIAWDEKVQFDIESPYYNVEAFKKGNNSLYQLDMDLLGHIEGKKILHAQCYFGLDSLSMARLGAEVTGLDFSQNAINFAKKLSAELRLKKNANFVCSNVYNLNFALVEKYDIVYSSYGAICWLPNLDLWAKEINRVLKDNGEFCIIDFHPLVISLDLFRKEKIEHSYFNEVSKPIRIERKGTYASLQAEVHTIEYNWNHSISEIFRAFAKNGFRIVDFFELPFVPMDGFPNLYLKNKNEYHVVNADDKYPLLFGLKVKKINGI